MTPGQNHNARFFIQEHLVRGAVFHGGIGNIDAEKVLQGAGYQGLRLGDEYGFGIRSKWHRLRAMLTTLRTLPKGATIVFQWPLYAKLHRILIGALRLFRKDVGLICFLTDINGVKDGNRQLLSEELDFLSAMNRVIVHNETMAAWLRASLPAARIEAIGFFDFLAPAPEFSREPSTGICFAGNLSKSGFLRRLDGYPGLQFFVYGETGGLLPGTPNVHIRGLHEPARLPAIAEGSFGLVWDGDEAESLAGPLGDYARLISPHKLSLYILAGLPVICAKDSAAAGLVEKYRIGFTVAGISEIAGKIALATKGEYAEMRERMRPLADRISTGRCLLDALEKLGG